MDENDHEQEDQEQEEELTLHIPPEQMAGVWANFARVSHSPHEFTIDFARITPDDGQAVVVSRVSVSPLFITQLIDALQQNWQHYAEKALPQDLRGNDD